MSFSLKDISAKQILTNFYFPPKCEKARKIDENDKCPSPLDFLLQEHLKNYTVFQNSYQTYNKFWINMYDFNKNGQTPMPNRTSENCWWCRHPFETSPLGIPLKYYSQEEINSKPELEKIFKKEFFETEGNFCCFCCVRAYIDEFSSTYSKYKKSSTLLFLMYYKLKGEYAKIPKSPSWKILKEYGGQLTIKQFRASIGNLYYIETVNLKRPLLYSSCSYIEEIKKE